MNKKELINYLSKKTDLKKTDCKNVLESFFDCIKQKIKNGEKVCVNNFGTFKVRYQNEKLGYNPHLKKPQIFSAKKMPVFKPSGKLKYIINC